MWRRIVFCVGLLLVCNAAESTEIQTSSSNAKEQLDVLVTEFWDWRLLCSPDMATDVHQDKLEVFTEQEFSAQKAQASTFLTRAEAVDGTSLGKQDKINKVLLIALLTTFIDGYDYREYCVYNYPSMMGDPLGSFVYLISTMKTRDETDYRNILARFRAFPVQIAQITDLMQKAIDLGKTRHAEAMTGVVDSFTASLVSLQENVTASSLYAHFLEMPDTIPAETRAELRQEARDLLQVNITNTYEAFRNFTRDVYMANTAADYGVGALPGGQAFYQAVLQWHTSLALTAEQVHQQGLQEVARIEQLMQQEMDKDLFQGNLQDYIAHLKTNPDNFYHEEDDMLNGYEEIIASVDEKLPSILTKIPTAKLEVRRTATKDTFIGSYSSPSEDGTRPGIFWANVFEPETKPKFDMVALTLHEAQPGHHTQAASLLEETGLPTFRRVLEYKYFNAPFAWLFHSAYTEGWALYAESLGEEMDSYTEPHTLFGRYVSEMFRAARLVVDTGLHAKGWSMQEAEWFMANYTTDPPDSITFEVKRYISWPGQACAYKMGELKMKELRARATDRLGSNFDLRKFHDEILQLGPVPLSLLEDHIEEWIVGNEVSAGERHGVSVLGVLLALLVASSQACRGY